MSAECEIDCCGVLAVGRCSVCGKRFCATHQARESNAYYVDLCAPCLQARRTAEREALVKDEQINGRLYLESGQAKKDLLDSGVARVQLHTVRNESVRKRFLGRVNVETVSLCGKGWLVGEFKWKYHPGGDTSDIHVTWQTVFLENVQEYKYHSNYSLVPVYRDTNGRWVIRTGRSYNLASDVRTVVAAIHKLTGR